ncbi:MAG: hypothetical protein ACREAK_03965 [Nitrosarchaeum sp.]
MTNKLNLFLFLAIATILIASPLASGNAFADDDKNKKSKDDKNDLNPFKPLWDAIAGLQGQIDNISLTPGPQGPTGPAGTDGSCSVEQIGNTAVITCSDGTTATITGP